jgi:hypothetical protein
MLTVEGTMSDVTTSILTTIKNIVDSILKRRTIGISDV